MQDNSQTRDALISKRDELLSMVDKLNLVISLFEDDLPKVSGSPSSSDTTKQANSIDNKAYVQGTIFSPSMPLESQVIEGFKTFGRFMKIQEFASELKKISKTSKTEGGIVNFVRDLKKKGKITSIKFDGSFTYTYWGLPLWISNDKGNIKDLGSYAPAADILSDNSTFEVIK